MGVQERASKLYPEEGAVRYPPKFSSSCVDMGGDSVCWRWLGAHIGKEREREKGKLFQLMKIHLIYIEYIKHSNCTNCSATITVIILGYC